MYGIIDTNTTSAYKERSLKKEFNLLNDPNHTFTKEQVTSIKSEPGIIFHSKAFFADSIQLSKELLIFHDARIFNIKELSSQLNLPQAKNDCQNTTHILLTAFEKWGKEFIYHIKGEFVIFFYNIESKEIDIFRDPMGLVPFYYLTDSNRFYFSTELRRLATLERCQQPNMEYISLSLQDIVPHSFDQTFFNSIYRLPPGSHMLVKKNLKIEVTKYFKFKIQKPRKQTYPQYLKTFQHYLELSVKRQMQGQTIIPCHFSGGLDSTGMAAIACELAQHDNKKIITYACGLNEKQIHNQYSIQDERKIITAISHNSKIPVPKIVSGTNYHLLNKSYEILKIPIIIDNSIYLKATCESLNQNNGKILLSGFGGDECITFNQAPTFLSNAFWTLNWKSLYKNVFAYNWKTVIKVIFPQLFKNDKLDLPIPLKSKKNNNLNRDKITNLDHFIQSYITSPFVTYRIEMEKEYASYFGIEMRYPYMDIDLITFFLSLPSKYKVLNGQGRRFYREAIKKWIDYTPFIEQRKSKVNTIPAQALLVRKHINENKTNYKTVLNNLSPELLDLINIPPIPQNWNMKFDIMTHHVFVRLANIDHFLKSCKSSTQKQTTQTK